MRVPPHYPPAERLDIIENLHGRRVADPYRWLEEPAVPQTEAWSTAQDDLLGTYRDSWSGRNRLRDRLTELMAVGIVTPPVWRHDRQFFLRRTGEQEHAVLLTVDPDGTERVLVDPTAIDPSGVTTLDTWRPSHEGDLLAYSLSEGGTERSVLRVLDVATGEVIDGPIDRCRYSGVGWLPGGVAFYYMRHLPDAEFEGAGRLHRRIMLHRVGTDDAEDVVVFGDGSPSGRYYDAFVSADGHWLAVTESQGTDPRNNAWIADLTESTPENPTFRVLQEDVDARCGPYVRNGVLYLWTDRDATRGRLCVTSTDDLDYASWRELVPEDPDAVLDDYVVLDGPELTRPVVVVSRLRHAVGELAVHDLATGEHLSTLELPGLGSVTSLVAPPAAGHDAWFTYTDFSMPATVYHYDGRTGTVSEWARPPGTVTIAPLNARQVTYTSKDGTEVRMFVMTADEPAPGPLPTVLYGYGGFSIPLTPAYSPRIVAWIEAGGAWAVANLRGGSEEGEQWHRAGMLGEKQNVFDDFHAAAEWLVAEDITVPGQLGIFGGSNGGLLVGAALTQRPELYSAAICSAPLLDMVRYELVGLGSTWAGEYGTAADPEQLDWLLSYSPYHRVREGVEYPAVLFTVFDGDTRVDPMHARKLAAALQHATSGTRPILVRREKDVGHAARSVSRMMTLLVDELSFLATYTGLPVDDT